MLHNKNKSSWPLAPLIQDLINEEASGSTSSTEPMCNAQSCSDSENSLSEGFCISKPRYYFDQLKLSSSSSSNFSGSTDDEYCSMMPWKVGSLVWARPMKYPNLPWWPGIIVERPLLGHKGRKSTIEILTVSDVTTDEDQPHGNRIKILRRIPVFRVCLFGGFHSGGDPFIDERYLAVLQTQMIKFTGMEDFDHFMRQSVLEKRKKAIALSSFVVIPLLQKSWNMACKLASSILNMTKSQNQSQTPLEYIPWINMENPDYDSEDPSKWKKSFKRHRNARKNILNSSTNIETSSSEEFAEKVVRRRRKKKVLESKAIFKDKRNEVLKKTDLFAFEYLGTGKSESYKSLFVCHKCERSGVLYRPGSSSNVSPEELSSRVVVVTCPGVCGNYSHIECVGGSLSDPGLCNICSEGLRQCFICKNTEKDSKLLIKEKEDKSLANTGSSENSVSTTMVKCNADRCRRWYHLPCLQQLPYSMLMETGKNDSFLCPQHICMSCVAENPGIMHRPLRSSIRCLKCPAAYHPGDWCVPAGSIEVTNNWIVCPQHVYGSTSPAPFSSPMKTLKCDKNFGMVLEFLMKAMLKPTNVSWCFICSKGGCIICCEKCPVSFHEKCLNVEEIAEQFICEGCMNGRLSRYGEIVWVRLPPTSQSFLERNYPDNKDDLIVNKFTEYPFKELFWSPNHNRLTSGMRWWPGEILHPRIYEDEEEEKTFNDDDQENKSHQSYIVPPQLTRLGFIRVKLFNMRESDAATKNMCLWTTNSRVFPFEEGDEQKGISDDSSSDENKNKTKKTARRKKKGKKDRSASMVLDSSSSSSGNEDDPLMLALGREDSIRLNVSSNSISKSRISNANMDNFKRIKFKLTKEEKQQQQYAYEEAVSIAAEGWKRRQKKYALSFCQTSKPDFYKKIKANHPIGSVRVYKPVDVSDIPICECKAGDTDPCGPSSNCFNRRLHYECTPAFCVHRKACRNQRFVLRQYPPQKPFKTVDGRGWGLKTLVDIKRGEFVNEYMGDLIDEIEANRRLKLAHENNIANFYMMQLDSNRIIDAGPKGNLSRFANHSCQPNLYTEKWTVNGDIRVGLFALADIKAEEELTFNYNFESLGQEMLHCKCGASNCVGYLGASKTNAADDADSSSSEADEENSESETDASITSEEAPPEKTEKNAKLQNGHCRLNGHLKKTLNSKSSLHSSSESELEPFCFRCGDEVIEEMSNYMKCPKSDCSKVYHLKCLSLTEKPTGIWYCPWHHCEMCGKPSSVFCTLCPMSFCQHHSEGSVTVIQDVPPNAVEVQNIIVCMEHKPYANCYYLP